MSLIKGPFLIKVNGHVLNHVADIVYSENKLTINILVTDFDMANLLLEKTPINRVYCISCCQYAGATYYTQKYTTSIHVKDGIMTLSIVFDVWRAKIGEITE